MSDKRRILFVDDRAEVLDGLRRMLHKMRAEWEMIFAGSGAEALAIMEQKPVEVVVTDMKMPVMNGAQLLRAVSEKYPGTIRFILSGHSDKELVLQAVGFAHRHLAKPCEPDELLHLLDNSLKLREALANDEMHTRISKISSLPSPPRIYQELLSLLQSEDASVKEVADLIAGDVSLTAKILQIVNSAFFGLPAHVDSPAQAVNLLGIDTVYGLTLSAGVFSQFEEPPGSGLSVESIHSHCILVGNGAKRIAKSIKLPQLYVDDSLLAGMLHDIGKLVMLKYFHEELVAALELANERQLSPREAEIEILGVCHAKIGAYLMSLWGLPDNILEAIAYHHAPREAPHAVRSVLTAVHIANACVLRGCETELDTDYLEDLGLGEELPTLQECCQLELV